MCIFPIPSRRSISAILALLTLTALSPTECGDRAPSATLRQDQVPRLVPSALTIVPGVHLLGELFPSAAYVVETSEGLVLIDSGLEGDARLTRSQLRRLGLDESRLRAILLTHVHGDHTGGAQRLREATGARVYAGRGDATLLQEGGPRDAFFSTFSMPEAEIHPVALDVVLDGGEEIQIGDARFLAIAAPGHTPGSLCYLLEHRGLRILFSGDVIMTLRGDDRLSDPTLRSPLGTYAAHRAPRYRGNARDFLASLRALRALPPPDLLLPGHPRMSPTPQSPAISRQRWEEMLDNGIRDMTTLLGRFERDGADFLDGQPKSLLPGLDYLGDFHGSAVYGLFTSSKFVLIDAPGGPGLADFVEQRLRDLGRTPQPPTAVLLTSADPRATAGLAPLIERYHAQVVASPEARSLVASICPTGTSILSTDDLPSQGWFEATPIPLAGRGQAPTAYRLNWAGKTVLLSGRIPVLPNAPELTALFADLATKFDNAGAYLDALALLATPVPNLWLPAIPSHGQNANLYEADWRQILDRNRQVVLRGHYP